MVVAALGKQLTTSPRFSIIPDDFPGPARCATNQPPKRENMKN